MVVRFPVTRASAPAVERVRRLVALRGGCDVEVKLLDAAPPSVPSPLASGGQRSSPTGGGGGGGGGGGQRSIPTGGVSAPSGERKNRRMQLTVPGVGEWTGSVCELPCIVESHKLCYPSDLAPEPLARSAGRDRDAGGGSEGGGDGDACADRPRKRDSDARGGDDAKTAERKEATTTTTTAAPSPIRAGGNFYKSCNISQLLVLDAPITAAPTVAPVATSAAPTPATPGAYRPASRPPPLRSRNLRSGSAPGTATTSAAPPTLAPVDHPDGLTPPARGIRQWYDLLHRPTPAEIIAAVSLLEALGDQNSVEEYRLGYLEEEVDDDDDGDEEEEEEEEKNGGGGGGGGGGDGDETSGKTRDDADEMSASSSPPVVRKWETDGDGDRKDDFVEEEEVELRGVAPITPVSRQSTPSASPPVGWFTPTSSPSPSSGTTTPTQSRPTSPLPIGLLRWPSPMPVASSRPWIGPAAPQSSGAPVSATLTSATSALPSATTSAPLPPPVVALDPAVERAKKVLALEREARTHRANLASTNKILRLRAPQQLAVVVAQLAALGVAPAP